MDEGNSYDENFKKAIEPLDKTIEMVHNAQNNKEVRDTFGNASGDVFEAIRTEDEAIRRDIFEKSPEIEEIINSLNEIADKFEHPEKYNNEISFIQDVINRYPNYSEDYINRRNELIEKYMHILKKTLKK